MDPIERTATATRYSQAPTRRNGADRAYAVVVDVADVDRTQADDAGRDGAQGAHPLEALVLLAQLLQGQGQGGTVQISSGEAHAPSLCIHPRCHLLCCMVLDAEPVNHAEHLLDAEPVNHAEHLLDAEPVSHAEHQGGRGALAFFRRGHMSCHVTAFKTPN